MPGKRPGLAGCEVTVSEPLPGRGRCQGHWNHGSDQAAARCRSTVQGAPRLLLGAQVRGIRRRALLAEERSAEEERLRRSEVRVARVSERTAVARELHDLVAHIASLMTKTDTPNRVRLAVLAVQTGVASG